MSRRKEFIEVLSTDEEVQANYDFEKDDKLTKFFELASKPSLIMKQFNNIKSTSEFIPNQTKFSYGFKNSKVDTTSCVEKLKIIIC